MKKIFYCLWIVIFSFASAAAVGQYSCPNLKNPKMKPLYEFSQGRDGWFFRGKSDLRPILYIPTENQEAMIRIGRGLASRGISLSIMLTPHRGALAYRYSESASPLVEFFEPKEYIESVDSYAKLFNENGIFFPNLTSALMSSQRYDDVFFKRDHHWTAQGAKRSAQLFSAEALTNGWIERGDLEYETLPGVAFEGMSNMETEINRLCEDPIPSEDVEVFYSQQKITNASSLFGNESTGSGQRVVLLGTSFSAMERFNFDGFLSEALGLQVENYATVGGGFFSSIISYLTSDDFIVRPPSHIIWEVPFNVRFSHLDKPLLRDLAGAAYGPCEGIDRVAEVSLEHDGQEQTQLFDWRSQGGRKVDSNHLMVEVEDPRISRITLLIDFTSGDREEIELKREGYMRNTQRYFLDMASQSEDSIAGVSLSGLFGTAGVIKAAYCKH